MERGGVEGGWGGWPRGEREEGVVGGLEVGAVVVLMKVVVIGKGSVGGGGVGLGVGLRGKGGRQAHLQFGEKAWSVAGENVEVGAEPGVGVFGVGVGVGAGVGVGVGVGVVVSVHVAPVG